MRIHALRTPTLSSESRSLCPQSSICAQCLFRQSFGRQAGPLPPSAVPIARRKQSSWTAAISAVQNTFSDVLPNRPASGDVTVDPLRIVAKELKFLNKNIRKLLGSGHPILDTVAKYYTQSEGKHVRPLLVLLMSRATLTAPKRTRRDQLPLGSYGVDAPMSSPNVLFDNNPDQPAFNPLTCRANEADYASPNGTSILPSQRRLAEIYQFLIPPGQRVLEIGCGRGDLLAAVNPSVGVGSPRLSVRCGTDMG